MAKGLDSNLLKNGKRIDGRDLEEMRPLTMKVGVLKRADGSAFVELGNTRILAAVFGPCKMHPQHRQDPKKAVLSVRYNMAPFSTSERVRPGPSRRSTEIGLVIKKALESIIFLEEFPKTEIQVFIEVLEANASTRVTGLTAASLALADAGIPMKGMVSSCSVGKIQDKLVLDVAGAEDSYGSADFPVATINGGDKVTLLQLDGDLKQTELRKALELAQKGNKILFEHQKEVLKTSYKIGEKNDENK